MSAHGDLSSRHAFEVRHTHDGVELLLHPGGSETPAPSVDEIAAALRGSAIASIDSLVIARALATHARNPHAALVTTVGFPNVPVSARPPCAILVSLDRLAAFAVPVQPPAVPEGPEVPEVPAAAPTDTDDAEMADSGTTAPPPAVAAPEPPLTAAELRRRLVEAGVTRGLLDAVIDAFADGVVLDEIRCVARGLQPVAGVDARLEYHIESDAPGAPTGRGSGSIDLHALTAHRFVSEQTVLVTRVPPIAGAPGYDVLGVVIEPPAVRDADLRQVAGTNTEVVGETLVAGITGRPVVNARGAVDVLPVFEVPGNLDFHVGNIEFPGDVIVRGDVRPGFSIVAGGSVTVGGLVEGASITAGHDVMVLGTVGEHRTTLEVGGDLRARYLHTTDARVAGTVTVASEVVGCTITAERITTGSQGRVVGGYIEATNSIDTGMFGSREGRSTEARVTSTAPDAVIRVRRAVEPGLLLSVGGASLQIRDELSGASFWNVHGTVTALAAGVDLGQVEVRRAEAAA